MSLESKISLSSVTYFILNSEFLSLLVEISLQTYYWARPHPSKSQGAVHPCHLAKVAGSLPLRIRNYLCAKPQFTDKIPEAKKEGHRLEMEVLIKSLFQVSGGLHFSHSNQAG